LTGNFNKKIYSVDNYDNLREEDFNKIKKTLIEERMRILRFLALKATKEKDAKTNKEIADHIKCTYKIDYDTSAARGMRSQKYWRLPLAVSKNKIPSITFNILDVD